MLLSLTTTKNFRAVALLLLLSSSPTTQAIKCGTKIAEPCLAETDVRYDKDASNGLADQNSVWGTFSGYYQFQSTSFDKDNNRVEVFNATLPSGEVVLAERGSQGWSNFTTDGSRWYRHLTLISPNAEDPQNGTSPIRYLDFWATSTYEKDGSAISLTTQGAVTMNDNTVFAQGDKGDISPAGKDNLTLTTTAYMPNGIMHYTTFNCLDPNCDAVAYTTSIFNSDTRLSHLISTYMRVTEQEYIDGLNAAYDKYNVDPGSRVPVPMTAACLSGTCPTEEDWCATDPECSKSPYQEPEGKMKGSVIAGFVVMGFVVFVAIFYAIYAYKMAQQKKRYRKFFAQRIAATMSVRASARSLTPNALAREFKKIDEAGNGRISKTDLWNFLNTGKAGEITEGDFNALWHVLDHDDTGEVDFLEFCAFLGSCADDYNDARMNRASAVAERISLRNSLAEKAAQSLLQKSIKDPKGMEAIADVEEGNQEEDV